MNRKFEAARDTGSSEANMHPGVTPHPKDERLNLRVDAATKALLQRAAEISGSRLTEFMLEAALTRAQSLVSQPSEMRLSHQEFMQVLDSVENPPQPTDYLVNALR